MRFSAFWSTGDRIIHFFLLFFNAAGRGVFFSEISTPGRVGWGLPPSSAGVFQEENDCKIPFIYY